MTSPVSLRVGTPADAEQLAEFARRNFADAFGPQNTPDDIELHLSYTYGPELQRRELGNPRFATMLAEAEGKFAGYAQLRDATPPASVTTARPIELLRFYVDRAWHGQGVAKLLMNQVVATAQERGAESIWLCVWQKNPRAIAFYSREGFLTVGTQDFLLGTDVQLDWVMVRVLRST